MLIRNNILNFVLISPLIGAFLILFIPRREETLLKYVALNASCLSFSFSLIILGFFKKSTSSFQFVVNIWWIPFQNLYVSFGVDGISLFFILLTTFLIPICLLASWNSVDLNLKEFLISFLILDFFLVASFSVLDLFVFYALFESTLIPMFLIIGVWGSRERKILAAYYFFMYTFASSVLMLLTILYLFKKVGSTNYEIITLPILKPKVQKFIFLSFFLAFGTKVPMIPMHLWLPEAHVEAPTAGSVFLAGVLLKLGIYGFIRFTLPIVPLGCFFFTPLVYAISLVSIIYASFTAIRQTDFKRIIAYTSIAHMNLVVIGVFSLNTVGIEGSILQCISHGFVASGLFLIISVVYDRYRTRIVHYYSGLALVMPIYSTIFLFFTLANMGFPGTSSFVGEFLILAGSFKVNTVVTFLGTTSVVMSGLYSLWLYNRICYGNLNINFTNKFLDLNKRELVIFIPLICGTFILGICPNIILDYTHISVSNLVETIHYHQKK